MNDPALKLINRMISSRLGELDASTRVIETHISIVMLTPQFAYKMKKPVDYGFVDFRTVRQRKFYCEEEVRLNKRLAPDLYIGVVPVTGSEEEPSLDGQGQAIDYLVKMHRFNESAELHNIVQRKQSIVDEMFVFAAELAGFHQGTLVADQASQYGVFEKIVYDAMQNFDAIQKIRVSPETSNALTRARSWSTLEASRCESIFRVRKRRGFVRECHGDLHLRNMVLLKGKVVAFDCLEFNAELRWIDVASEIAFLLMDLSRKSEDLVAAIVLNHYLECSGDYDLLSVLRFYIVYRAMVRVKVSSFTLGENATKKEADSVIRPYIDVIEHTISQEGRTPSLILMHGLSGCGKSWLSLKLRENPGVIHIRSDIVRKSTCYPSNNPDETGSELTHLSGSGYTAQSRAGVYRELERIAGLILESGYTAIVDATFLKQGPRQQFYKLALDAGAKFHIVHLDFPVSVLEDRIVNREKKGDDPSEANLDVLRNQIEHHDALSSEEKMHALVINEKNDLGPESLMEIARKLQIS